MKRVLFVRSGGGFPGIDIHAGIWMALADAGITPTACVGTSAGAIVSGIQASGQTAEFCVSVLKGLVDSDLKAALPLWKFRLPWISYIYKGDPILDMLLKLVHRDYADLVMPLSIWATRADNGEPVDVARPEISPDPPHACLASAAICGIFPSVCLRDGHHYVDGGVRRNLPIPADWRTYDEVWLLIASSRPRDYVRQNGVVTNLIRNVQYLMQDQIEDVLDETRGAANVRVIWPTLTVSSGMLHFDHKLIDLAYRYTADHLKAGDSQ